MRVSEDMRGFVQEIISSYESRISMVGTIINDAYRILEDFKSNTNIMSERLKRNLASETFLRKKDFENMMGDVFAEQEEKEKEIKDLLRNFLDEQREIAEIIKGEMADDKKAGVDNFKKVVEYIQTKQKDQEEELIIRLKEFQKEYNEISDSMRSLLDKGKVIQIKDFKEMLGKIRLRQVEREDRRSQNSDRRVFLPLQDRNVPPIQRNSFVTGYIL